MIGVTALTPATRGSYTTGALGPRMVRQVKPKISMLEDKPMPISKSDTQFGGKPGSALKAMQSMQRSYGPKKGTSVFYATKNRNKKRNPMASMQRY